eukprot:13688393-Alexandrium_andersonii.AAC.1
MRVRHPPPVIQIPFITGLVHVCAAAPTSGPARAVVPQDGRHRRKPEGSDPARESPAGVHLEQ